MIATRVIGLGLSAMMFASTAQAQDSRLRETLRDILKLPAPAQTPIKDTNRTTSLNVTVLYDGETLEGPFLLEVTLSKPSPDGATHTPLPVSGATLYLDGTLDRSDVALTLPRSETPLLVDAVLRNANRDIVLQAAQPVSATGYPVLELVGFGAPSLQTQGFPDFTAVETIAGTVKLPKKARPPTGSTLYVQLLENALAGGLSMSLAAESVTRLTQNTAEIPFSLERGLWNRGDTPDLALKAWISDPAGRKIFVMRDPVGYNGPDIDYTLAMDSLKQGQDTKRGRNLPMDLMAQTLVQGEASFDPVNGIPGEARLKVVLKQDRGAYNRNPVLSEQTLLLRNMETRVPFSLTTDSTHFDPYAPAPFLTVSLTDNYGRIYYSSGDVRAREGFNRLQLYPR